MQAGDYDAIILACAGLERLGLSRFIRHRLDAPSWLPAVAQGAIAIECRADDAATIGCVRVLDHAPTRTCVEAERAMNRQLHGSCHVPVAAYATLDGGILSLEGLVGSADSGECIRISEVGRANDPEGLGRLVAAELRLKGAEGIARVFFCTLVGRRIVMLHSFIKKTGKTPLRELEIAQSRLKELKRADS